MKKNTAQPGNPWNTVLFSLLAALCLCATVRADITTGLLSYYKLDESSGTSAADAQAYSPNAALNGFAGTEWIAQGRTNGALRFSGTAQYAAIDDSTNGLNFAQLANQSFTLSAWVRGTPGVTQPNGVGLITRGYGGGGEQFLLDVYQGAFRFGLRNSGGTVSLLQLTPAPTNTLSGVWQHVAAVFDSAGGANNMKLYLNSQLIGQMTGPTALLDNAHEVSLGARESSISSGYNVCFNGMMDEVRIYNRALAAADVLELFQAPGAMAPVVYTQPPAALGLYVGDLMNLGVDADGTAPLAYQWRQNGADILNATAAAYNVASLALADAGPYDVVITNSVNSVTSTVCVVTVSDPPADISSGLVSHFKLDETTGSLAADATSATGGATIQNFTSDAQWAPAGGRTNGGYNFPGLTNPLDPVSGQYGVISDPTNALDFSAASTPALSVAAWIKTPPGFGEPGGVGLVAKGYGRGGEQYVLDLFVNGPRFFVQNASGTYFNARADISGIAVNNGAWTHLVGVLDPTVVPATIKLFVNGRIVITAPGATGALMTSDRSTTLGAREDSNVSGYNLPFTGLMDDVRIYNRALTPSDVQALYASVGTAAPSFVVSLADTTNYVLAPVTVTVTADGTVPLSYQWQWYGTNLPGATNTTYSIASAAISNSGPYSVVVTNAYGSAATTGYLAMVELATNDYTTALVAEWNFEETSGLTAADSSGRGNALALNNFVGDNSQWVTTARIGSRALRLNSSTDPSTPNDYLRNISPMILPYNSNLFTFAFWIKLDSSTVATYPRVITPEYTGVANQFWVLWKSTATIGAGFYLPQASTVPGLNVWRHFAATYDRSVNRYSLYVNGVRVLNNIAPTHVKNVPNPYWIIGHNESTTVDTDYFRGQLDDLRVYNRVLTDTQVAALYGDAPPFLYILSSPQSASASERDQVSFTVSADGSAPLAYQWQKDGNDIPGGTAATLTLPYVSLADNGTTYRARVSNAAGTNTSASATLTVVTALPAGDFANDLIAHYTFDDASGSAATNSVGSNHATLGNFPDDNSQWQPGVLGGALRFNSVDLDDYVITDSNVQFTNNDNFTFSFWAKRDPGAQGTNPRLICPVTTHWVVWRPTIGVGLYSPAASPEPVTNNWRHFVVVVDRLAGRYSLYGDGVRRVWQAGPYTKAVPSDVQWVFGHHETIATHTEGFRGLLDDVRIYNRRFNINDAEALYQAANIPPPLSMQVSGSTLTFSWPSWASGYTLKSSSSLLPGATWTAVGGSAALSGATMIQTDTAGSGPMFYRLVK